MDVLLVGIAVQLVGGGMAYALSPSARCATAVGVVSAVVGAALGLAQTWHVLIGGGSVAHLLPWDAAHGPFHVAIDPLSAAFLVPLFVLTILAAIYGGDYLFAYRTRKLLGVPWFAFNGFVAGMTLVLIARTALVFLVGWEIMSVAAYFLVTLEHEKEEVRRAGWVYLVATHLGVAFVTASILLLGCRAGSQDFAAFQAGSWLTATEAGVVFVLALIGFGTKAGLVPFHVWLPEAHPAAPSHVSALMSGMMTKTGIYGILRIMTFLGPPAPWWGLTLAGIGMVTAFVGIALALQQRDIKRVLAYSSIENIGLITLAMGVGVWGQATHRPLVAGLGMTAMLLHVWNHAVMKSMMFFAAGSVLHGTGTRDLEQMGGLMKRMPWTGGAMALGAVAIAALPPLNGFASKWLIYLALLQCGLTSTSDHGLTALLSIGLLALIGAMAALAFVRLIGIALLGSARSPAADHAHESSLWLRGPMLLLGATCVVLAVAPSWGVVLLDGTLLQILGNRDGALPESLVAVANALETIGAMHLGVWGALGIVGVALMFLLRRMPSAEHSTWGCGYVQPSPRIQYTSRSFAELLARCFLPRFLRPRMHVEAPEGLFPAPGKLSSESPDPFSEKGYEPFFARWARRFAWLRILQQGQVNIYLAYVVLTVVLALAWMSIRAWWRAGA